LARVSGRGRARAAVRRRRRVAAARGRVSPGGGRGAGGCGGVARAPALPRMGGAMNGTGWPLAVLRDAFAWPWLLLALPLPWLLRALLPAAPAAGAALRAPWGERLAAVAAAAGGAVRAPGVHWLAWLAWALLCVAAARPVQFGPPVAPPQASRGMMLAVDLSGSMADEDMALRGRLVDRLTAAKA